MSDIGHAIYRAMSHQFGGREPVSSPDTMRGRLARMHAVEKAAGSPKAAAAVVGVSPETWRRWKLTGPKQQHPSLPRLSSLVRASNTVYRAMSQRTAERALKHAKIRVCADVRWNGYLDVKKPYRSTNLDPLDLSAWAAQWVRADFTALAQELWHQMHEHYGVSVLFEGDRVLVYIRE